MRWLVMQRFLIDLEGYELTDVEKQLITHPEVLGLVVFTRNFKTIDQIHTLIKSIRAINRELVIATDHEGGFIQRFIRCGLRALPSARSMGEVYDLNVKCGLDFARQNGKVMAFQLIQMGIDVSLAPVLDLHGSSQIIGRLDRAFHSNPDIVAELAKAFIEGMKSVNMPAIGKHFPGHGLSLADSHLDKTVSSSSFEQLLKTEIKPYAQLIQENALAGIMPAHITYEKVDAQNSAGYSSIWLKNILRKQLKFDNIILSDCLSMAGADLGDLFKRASKALEAGCDIVIISNQERHLILELLNRNFKPGDNESLTRIQIFKNKLFRFINEDFNYFDTNYFQPSNTKNTEIYSSYNSLNKTLKI